MAIDVYRTIEGNEKLNRDFGLKDQLQRSAVSIPSNIAEGDELRTIKNGIRHFYIAKGSCAELITQLMIARDIGKLESDKCEALISKAKHISASLFKLIEARANWNHKP